MKASLFSLTSTNRSIESISNHMSRKRSRRTTRYETVPDDKHNATLSKVQWQDIFRSPWFIPLIGVFLLLILLSLRLIIDVDLGFHLRGGQWMLENRSFHRHDVFTYTVNNHEYIAMYWLYQIGLFITYTLFGYGGISIINTLLLASVFFIACLRMKHHHVRPGTAAIILLPAVIAVEIRFGVRPEIMTWLAILGMLIVLDQYYRRRRNLLFLLPVIQLLWVNLHGLFIIGWFLVGAYFISKLFHDREFDKSLFRWSLITILVSFMNPYFIKGVLFPFYLFTRLQGSNVFKAVITELTSPWSIKALTNMPGAPLYIYYAFSLVSLLLLIFTWRKRKLHELLIFPAFFYLSYAAVRNIPIFILAVMPLIGNGLDYLASHVRIRSFVTYLKPYGRPAPLLITLFIVLLCLRIVTNAFYAGRRGGNFGIGLDEKTHPVAAAEFINAHGLKARFINDLNRGSWLIWATRQPVFIDGRLEVVQEDFFREYQRSFAPGGMENIIAVYDPRFIIFDYSYPEAMLWEIQLQQKPDWRKIYWDQTSVIYAQNAYRPDLKTVDFMSVAHAMDIDTAVSSDQIWRSLQNPEPSRFTAWLQGFYRHKYFPAELGRMAYYASVNLEFRAAELLYFEFTRRTDQNRYAAYLGLGTIYMLSEKLDRAIGCYELALRENPRSETAARRIKEIKEYLRNKPLLHK